MIQGIRRKFILIAMAVLSVVMIALAGVINLSNWINVRGEMSETLDSLANSPENSGRPDNRKRGRDRHMQNALDESRYFLVRLDGGGEYMITDATRAARESAEDLEEVVRAALASGKDTGMAGAYMYRISANGNGRGSAVFLNCETRLDAVHRLLLISGIACAGGIAAAWLLVVLFSRRAVQPLIRNAVQQKQFITDAGHELKTPLTVISANMDAMELKTGPNEWIDSTREQVSGMGSLVSNMIYLSRMDEDGAVLAREPVCLSDLVVQEAGPFQAMAEFAGKTMEIEPGKDLCLEGDRNALGRMVNQLCDNALKYSPDGDLITLRLEKAGREIRLTEENGLKEPMSAEALSHLFDRFYRPDASRSRESGGYGIGLSMVRAVAEKHGGKASAGITAEGRIRFTVVLPA